MKRVSMVGVVSVMLAACATEGEPPPAYPQPSVLDTQEIGAHGTRSFNAPLSKVFAATVAALKSLGYDIAAQVVGKGIIRTTRKLVRSQVVGSSHGMGGAGLYSGSSSAVTVDFTRQYLVNMRESEDGQVVVVVRPKVFAGENDLSEQPIWALDGPAGERQLWKALFQTINELL